LILLNFNHEELNPKANNLPI